MLKFALSSLIICIFLYGHAVAQDSKIDSSKMVTLRIDPSSARGASVSQFFDEVNFIPLETTKESLFGSISQLKMTDENYFVFDWETKAVLIFTKAGKYVAKISANKIEKDPADKSKQDFHGFNLKTVDGKTLITIASGKRTHYFDLTGKFVKKITADTLDKYADSKRFSDGTIIDQYYYDKEDKDSTKYHLSLIKDGKKSEMYFPQKKDEHKNDEGWHGGRIYDYGNPDEFLYVKNYLYNIYKLNSKKLSLAYQIFFPAANSLPLDYDNNPKYDGKRYDYFEQNRDIFYEMANAYLHGNNLYFQVRNWSWSRDEKRAFVYNLNSNDLTSVSDIEPDSVSQFLPITDLNYHYDFTNRGFLIVDKDYFYTSYSSLALFTVKEQNDGKNRKYDPVLTEFFKTQSRKSNPIIVQLKPKKK
jgi:hypothetical protein